MKLVQDKQPPGVPETRHFEDSNNQNDNDVKLLPVRGKKGLRIEAANKKPVSSKLLLALTKLALKIRQNVRAKKVIILNTS